MWRNMAGGQRWQGHQHTWSMEGLTLRRELRIQATTSTMLTYTFQKGLPV